MAQHNLRVVMGFEVRRTLTTKRFWISTLVVPVVIGIVFALVFLSNSSTSNSVDSQKNAKLAFSYSDASGQINDAIASKLGGTKVTDGDQAIAEVKSGKLDAYFAYPQHPAKQAVKAYGTDEGVFANGKYSSLATTVLQLSAQQAIGSPELAALAQGQVEVTSVTYKDGKVAGGISALVPPLFFLVIFYVVILLLGNQMLSSTLEEKENRVTEMILTTVNPTTLIVGKIAALFVIGLVQVLVFALPVIIGYLFFRESLALPGFDISSLVFDPQKMIVGALLLIGGFVLFTGTLVAIGAAMPSVKDAGAFFGMMMALIFIPFYIVTLIVSDPSAFIVQLFTYFPFSAPVTAMLRNGFGSLELWQSAIIIVELFGLGYLVLRLAVRLFRFGSIEYTRKVSLKTALARQK
ncbi:MAG TPA: ABC transporter permease [Lacisediminihabitans sp.]|jgi:ABC-2 type transport system permease protein|nr:ABC transporter permease [Lacisediminihabitans sp.]HXD60610.1 ABC transporter permease [Lacisediminihabitans sp.]